MRNRLARFVGAAVAVAMLATTALAQDYTSTVTTASGDSYETPPSSATTLSGLTGQDDAQQTVTLPFSFPYYGSAYSSISVCTNGFAQFGGGTSRAYSNLTLPQSGTNDGVVCPLWDDLYLRSTGTVKTWTAGTAPTRRFIISWEGVPHISSSTSRHTFQIKLFEESGHIVFAYTNTSSYYLSRGYTVGIDEPSGTRYVYATGKSGSNNTTTPSNYRFEPDITNFTGRVLIEEISTGANGYGSETGSATPLAGARIEIRTGGVTAGSGFTDANGDFSARGIALNSGSSGSLHLVAGSVAATVTPSTSNADRALMSAPYSITIDDSISFGGDNSVGTFTLDSTTDSDGSVRASIQIAQTIDRMRTAASQFTTAAIDPIDVFYSPNSAAPSRFTTKTSTAFASMRVAGATASNPDALDPAVVSRLYARHLIHAITGSTSTAYTASLDVVQSDEEAAFADGVGLMIFAALTGETVAYDGVTSNSVDALDLETPSLTRSPGPAVGGWVAAAMFDLLDAANEDHDTVDGTSGSNDERPFEALAAIQGTASSESFLDAWVNKGYPGGGIVTDFIHHGLLLDDANEPNDSMSQAQPLGTAGLRATGLRLNRFNEDWFTVEVPEAAGIFFVEMAYDRFANVAQVAVEVFTADGSRVGIGVPDGTNGPIVATMQDLPAGTAMVRIAHEGGDAIDSYALQAYAQMSVALTSAPAWTVGRRIQEPLDLRGGIPPYSVVAKDGGGDLFQAIQFLPSQTGTPFDMVWTPQEVGDVIVQITSTDSGVPAHTRTLSLTFTVNAELAFSAPELTGVALNKVADVNLGRVGGTDPITLTNEFGDLPGGLTVDPDFHIRGTADQPGGGAFGFDATDVAGSSSEVDSFLVVCVPIETKKQPVPLAGGQAAAGFYFDALAGSVCSMKLKTAKKRAKRELNFLVIGPDGNVVQGGTPKIKSGAVTLKNLGIPTTGRYFMAFESDDGGAETELQGTLKLKVPKKAAGTIEAMELDGLYKIEFGALAGATLSVKGKTTEGMEIRVLFIIQPDGDPVPFDDIVVENNNGKVKINTAGLAQDGTYQLYVAPLKTDLADFHYKLKIKQPKGGVFRLDD